MLYFGNDIDNIDLANRIGVDAMIVEHGITMQKVMVGLYNFANKRKIKDAIYL